MKFNLFENNSFKMQLKSNSKLIIFLGILAISSIFLKLYSIDLELPLYKDNLDLTMRAFAHLDGNFEVSPIFFQALNPRKNNPQDKSFDEPASGLQ